MKTPEITPEDYRALFTTNEIVECCPECETENTIVWNIVEDGWRFHCPKCGQFQHCCDVCTYSEDNPEHHCDWDEETETCFRDRQHQKYLESINEYFKP